MISGKIIRNIYTTGPLWNSSSKSLLAKLRKRTGYAFTNCKKALEMHENDLDKAEQWLKEQAQALGWAKAEKVQGRSIKQGLIAGIINERHAALVEINCETDFVARNQQFHALAETVASAVLKHATALTQQNPIMRSTLNAEVLKNLPAADGKSIADHAALLIGSVGENVGVTRATCLAVSPEVQLVACTHPAPINPSLVSFGRYGALLAYKSEEENEQLGMQLCQHIIGMAPKQIGDAVVDQPNPNGDEETAMIYQEYLLDPDLTIQQLLADTKTEIIDFARFEIGETTQEPTNIVDIETGG